MALSKRAEMDDGHFVHYTDTGGDLPAIIMLHGIGAYGTQDYANEGHVEGLKSVARVIVVDYRGHGQSCHAPAETCTLETNADDLSIIMENCELKQAETILYGMSGGWSIVLTYVRKYGAKFKGLICEDMIPVYPPGKVEGWGGFFGSEMAEQMIPVLLKDRWSAMEGFKPIILGPPGMLPDEVVAAKWAKILDNVSFLSGAAFNSYMKELSTYDCTDVLPTIKAANTPGLVLIGKNGLGNSGEADKVKMAGEMGAKHIIYEKSGHFVHMCEPAKSIADMAAFIKGL